MYVIYWGTGVLHEGDFSVVMSFFFNLHFSPIYYFNLQCNEDFRSGKRESVL